MSPVRRFLRDFQLSRDESHRTDEARQLAGVPTSARDSCLQRNCREMNCLTRHYGRRHFNLRHKLSQARAQGLIRRAAPEPDW